MSKKNFNLILKGIRRVASRIVSKCSDMAQALGQRYDSSVLRLERCSRIGQMWLKHGVEIGPYSVER